jgi:hypothetical protein
MYCHGCGAGTGIGDARRGATTTDAGVFCPACADRRDGRPAR